jgi:hypothetical protein
VEVKFSRSWGATRCHLFYQLKEDFNVAGKDRSTKDKMMAKYMKDHPSSYPDSVTRPHNGVGRQDVIEAQRMGSAWKSPRVYHERGEMQPKGTYPKGYRHRPNYGHSAQPKLVALNGFRITLTGNASTELLSVFGEALKQRS